MSILLSAEGLLRASREASRSDGAAERRDHPTFQTAAPA
jgi:hypothetical protein